MAVCAGLLVLAATRAAVAGSLEVRVVDAAGEAIADAVVVARGSEMTGRSSPRPAIVDQIDRTFVPHVLAVEVGTSVGFPNSDDVRHHVYSFSEAKSFELPLYKGTPAEPVHFDQAGVVALGCNIHDTMSAYVYVTESPYFAVSRDDGTARITDLPAGAYRVETWHPRQKEAAEPLALDVISGRTQAIDIRMELEPGLQILRGPASRRRRY